ncbi:MAG: outer membrane protein assembly factor BamC [Psychromonas sp.]
MKITFKHYRNTTAVIVALSLSACVRFETRMQANGDFEYQKVTLTTPYQTGSFSNHEARNQYDLPPLTEQQKVLGMQGIDVDIRPPTQLLAVIDGVLVEHPETGGTKIWFNNVNQNDNIQDNIWSLTKSYLAENNVDIINQNNQLIETGIFSEQSIFGGFFNENILLKESSYKLTLEEKQAGQGIAITVNALTYAETNDAKELNLILKGRTKQDVELHFINELLEYVYDKKESEKLDSAKTQSLAIKLGFDDNHQSAWIADNEFLDTWNKLPALLTLLNFSIVDFDKNLGYFLLDYSEPSESYWSENNLKPFELDSGEYFIQLGEVTGGTTSIAWLDEDKKPLSDQKITEIYFSITAHIRDAFLEKESR